MWHPTEVANVVKLAPDCLATGIVKKLTHFLEHWRTVERRMRPIVVRLFSWAWWCCAHRSSGRLIPYWWLAPQRWGRSGAFLVGVVKAQTGLTARHGSSPPRKCLVIKNHVDLGPLEALRRPRPTTIAAILQHPRHPLKVSMSVNDGSLVCHEVPDALGEFRH